ncbi:hypothetical protein [Paenibacillus rigui]|uniref:hypothetical protein n=1 Tax=Paenibacillus rigui TaxID=554312 RepID=UPI0015C644F0|nr:hypothetical protein [Paenibacillus rigui]
MKVTISRLPESVLDELEDYLEQQDIDEDQMRVFQALLTGYDAAWDKLDRINGGQDT